MTRLNRIHFEIIFDLRAIREESEKPDSEGGGGQLDTFQSSKEDE